MPFITVWEVDNYERRNATLYKNRAEAARAVKKEREELRKQGYQKIDHYIVNVKAKKEQ